MFSMEQAGRGVSQVARESLDSGLIVLFDYIKALNDVVDTEDKDPLKTFYFDFLSVFEAILLPVYATGHVQVNKLNFSLQCKVVLSGTPKTGIIIGTWLV
jgi:hypothetical protein